MNRNLLLLCLSVILLSSFSSGATCTSLPTLCTYKAGGVGLVNSSTYWGPYDYAIYGKYLYNMTTGTSSGSSYNETYATWLPNYTLYNKYWYNMTVGIGGGSSYNETYATWLPNFTLYNKYWYNQSTFSYNLNTSYNLWWYNQSTFSYNLNISYNLWWYNQSLYPITTLNTSYNKWWYNQTNGVETNDFIHRDGTVPLIANWNAGNYNISSQQGFQYNTTSPQGVSFNATCTIIKGTSGARIEVC